MVAGPIEIADSTKAEVMGLLMGLRETLDISMKVIPRWWWVGAWVCRRVLGSMLI